MTGGDAGYVDCQEKRRERTAGTARGREPRSASGDGDTPGREYRGRLADGLLGDEFARLDLNAEDFLETQGEFLQQERVDLHGIESRVRRDFFRRHVQLRQGHDDATDDRTIHVFLHESLGTPTANPGLEPRRVPWGQSWDLATGGGSVF